MHLCRGEGANNQHEAKYVNRVLRWTLEGFEVESDPEHADMLLKEWRMEQT